MNHNENISNSEFYSLEEAFDDGTLYDLNDSIYHEMSQIIYEYPVMITGELLDFIISINYTKDPKFSYHEIVGEILTKSLFGKLEFMEPATQTFLIRYEFKGETLTKKLKIKSQLGTSGEPIIIISLP
ncbi:hypothetical protein [Leptospira stimsonii]|uniref:Uncharacterized protein n=1 Tax=Leptospira stimsonii TaxID=2202203 RepID=A0ABY2N9K2_9LEPT|nr:hypothetical protein [Leptospira stimsonii]TGK19037.1 hypothetical protein EHO98_12120 [Leptospira stimsonii]TGM18966.1 hypothetical protein EHQ90_05415 [Leptospira stimsonii]